MSSEKARGGHIGPYQLAGVLGQGGMGVVHRAVHRVSGAEVALKTVISMKGHQLASLRAEIRSLARLRHRGIVRVIDEGLDGGSPWYAMELVEGRTLTSYLDVIWERQHVHDVSTLISSSISSGDGARSTSLHAAMPKRRSLDTKHLPELLLLLRQLCEALAYVHDQGMIHRDIKPANIFLRASDMSAVLMDFGLASRFRGSSGRESLRAGSAIRAGTLAYMAPEQLRGEQVDARADLYSVGCIAYEFLTGQIPGDQAPGLNDRRAPLDAAARPSEIADGVPPALDALVQGLLAARPQDRVGYAADVLEALDAMESDHRATQSARMRGPGSPRSYLYRPRLAGRAEEMDYVWRHVEALKPGGAGVALCIGGESGSGKTTFANDVAHRAARAGLSVIGGECLPLVGETTVVDPREAPLHPFRPFLRVVADYCRSKGAEHAGRILGPWGKVLSPHEPALENVPGLERFPHPQELAGEATRDRLLGALQHVIVSFAAERPLLLILDDIQWADELSLSFLRSLPSDILRHNPIAIIGTFRTEETFPELNAFIDHPNVLRVALPRLEPETVASMAADMLGMAKPPQPLVDFLVKTSEGSPFFLAEYLRAAVAEGLLVRESGRWFVSGQSDSGQSAYEAIQLPRSLRGLITRRLAGLSARALGLAMDAAVLGRTGDLATLALMRRGSAEDFSQDLSELVDKHVLDASEDSYSFVHDKIRESAFDYVAAQERRAAHLRAAEALEEVALRSSSPPDAQPDLFQRAYQYRCAGHTEKAFHYAYLAGRRALAAGAFKEASEHLGGALKLLESNPEVLIGLEPAQERAQLRRSLGEALVVSGRLREGIDSLRRACRELGVPAPAERRAAWAGRSIAELLRLIIGALLPRRWMRVRDEPKRAALEGAAEMNRLVSSAYLFLGRPIECIGAAFLSARLAQRAGAQAQQAGGYSFLAGVAGMAGLRRLEARLFDAARKAARSAQGVVPMIWEATMETVFLHYRNADWRALDACAEGAIARASEHNLVYDRQPLDFMFSISEFEKGAPLSAQATLERVLALAANFGHEIYAVSARGTLMLYDLYAGRFAKIIEVGNDVAALHRAERLEVDLFVVLTTVAVARWRSGDAQGATDTIEAIFALLRSGIRLEARPIAVRALYDFADLMCSCWQQDADRGVAAPRTAARARRIYGKVARFAKGRRHMKPAAALLVGRIAQLRGRPGRASALFARAATIARTLNMPPFEAFARFSLAQLPTLPRGERGEHLEAAMRLFQKMNFAWHLQRAEALARNLDLPTLRTSASSAGGSDPIRSSGSPAP